MVTDSVTTLTDAGDPPRSLVKIDLPHLCNRDIQQLVADPKIGAWAAGVPTPEPPFHSPDLLDSYACPVLFGLPPADVAV